MRAAGSWAPSTPTRSPTPWASTAGCSQTSRGLGEADVRAAGARVRRAVADHPELAEEIDGIAEGARFITR